VIIHPCNLEHISDVSLDFFPSVLLVSIHEKKGFDFPNRGVNSRYLGIEIWRPQTFEYLAKTSETVFVASSFQNRGLKMILPSGFWILTSNLRWSATNGFGAASAIAVGLMPLFFCDDVALVLLFGCSSVSLTLLGMDDAPEEFDA